MEGFGDPGKVSAPFHFYPWVLGVSQGTGETGRIPVKLHRKCSRLENNSLRTQPGVRRVEKRKVPRKARPPAIKLLCGFPFFLLVLILVVFALARLPALRIILLSPALALLLTVPIALGIFLGVFLRRVLLSRLLALLLFVIHFESPLIEYSSLSETGWFGRFDETVLTNSISPSGSIRS